MTRKQFLKLRILFTLTITLALAALLLYQYFNEGIPNHHFLARTDMPRVSNAWGLLTIPLFTWFMLYLVDKRIFKNSADIIFPKAVFVAFVASLIFGIILGVSIQTGVKEFSGNVPIILFVLALFFPTYRAEYFLGFVLGLTYFVGGVLPIVVGSVFLLLSALIYLLLRRFILWGFRSVVK